MDEGTVQLSDFFRLVGNDVRFDILLQLRDGGSRPEKLGNELNRSPDTISRHLGTLRNHDLVRETNGNGFELKRPDLVEKCLEFRNYLARPGNGSVESVS